MWQSGSEYKQPGSGSSTVHQHHCTMVHKPRGAAAVATACHAQLQQLRCLKPLVQCHKGSMVVHNGLSQRIPGAVTA